MTPATLKKRALGGEKLFRWADGNLVDMLSRTVFLGVVELAAPGGGVYSFDPDLDGTISLEQRILTAAGIMVGIAVEKVRAALQLLERLKFIARPDEFSVEVTLAPRRRSGLPSETEGPRAVKNRLNSLWATGPRKPTETEAEFVARKTLILDRKRAEYEQLVPRGVGEDEIPWQMRVLAYRDLVRAQPAPPSPQRSLTLPIRGGAPGGEATRSQMASNLASPGASPGFAKHDDDDDQYLRISPESSSSSPSTASEPRAEKPEATEAIEATVASASEPEPAPIAAKPITKATPELEAASRMLAKRAITKWDLTESWRWTAGAKATAAETILTYLTGEDAYSVAEVEAAIDGPNPCVSAAYYKKVLATKRATRRADEREAARAGLAARTKPKPPPPKAAVALPGFDQLGALERDAVADYMRALAEPTPEQRRERLKIAKDIWDRSYSRVWDWLLQRRPDARDALHWLEDAA